MKLGKRMVALLCGASGLLLVILAIPAPRAGTEPTAPAPAHPVEPTPAGEDAIGDSALLLEQRRRARELAWVRDPFAPAGARTSAPPASSEAAPVLRYPVTPALTGISICGDDCRAVIDRQVVKSGDRLASGYTVGKISARTVMLTRDQEELVLCLGEQP